MVTTAKAQVISDGCIAIPEDWVNAPRLDDGTSVELSVSDDMQKVQYEIDLHKG